MAICSLLLKNCYFRKFLLQGGKTKILFPIYFEEERPPTAGVPEGVIEREEFVTDVQRFPRGHSLPHTYFDDSPWYLIHPGEWRLPADTLRVANLSFV